MMVSPYYETMNSRNISARPNKVNLTKHRLAFLTVVIVALLLWITATRVLNRRSSSTKCIVSHGTYSGSIYTKSSETLSNKCLVESPWMRLAQHSVRLANSKVVNDWLWIDYHDRINVLVEAPPQQRSAATDGSSSQGNIFMILEQTKYALDEMSLAVVGGIIEPEEDAGAAAQREVDEELSVTCQNWIALGKFRTDVNRGMGWVHPYLAKDCTYSSSTNNGDMKETINPEEVGGHDTEKQRVQIMTLPEVKKAVMGGKFVEVQWSNTVALAMLYLS